MALAGSEARERIDTVYWAVHVALLSTQRYRALLESPDAFMAMFPGVEFDNPKITHSVDGHGVQMTTTKRELLEPHNYDLYKAWQVLFGIAGMSSVLDVYLSSKAQQESGTEVSVMGIFSRFSKLTGIKLSEYPGFQQLRHFHEVRNISFHNLGRANQRFGDKTADPHHPDGPYVFYPQQLKEYRDLLVEVISYIEARSKKPRAV